MRIDRFHLGFEPVVFFRLVGIQGGAVSGGLFHDLGHASGLGLAGGFKLADLFSDVHVCLLGRFRVRDDRKGRLGGARSAGRSGDLLGPGQVDLFRRRMAGRGPLIGVDRLDAVDGAVGIGRDGHQRELEDLELQESNAAAFQQRVFKGAEADRDRLHEPELHRLPGFVEPIFQRAGLVGARHADREGDALRRRLAQGHMAHRLMVVVLPEGRDLGGELGAERLQNIAHAVG
ncbi:hypothetical protein D3C86_1537170 [compost metagenome]